ncbi:MAG: winged helix-turn-helix domain-containing protein, partial [Candidatus Hermodarchaeota archaeon]
NSLFLYTWSFNNYNRNSEVYLVHSSLSGSRIRGDLILDDLQGIQNGSRFNTDIDKVIHVPSRLIILSYLYVVKNADMIFFKEKTKLSWGNLSSHASKLEEAGYINILKTIRNNKPVTILEITETGKRAFKEYKDRMTELLSEK